VTGDLSQFSILRERFVDRPLLIVSGDTDAQGARVPLKATGVELSGVQWRCYGGLKPTSPPGVLLKGRRSGNEVATKKKREKHSKDRHEYLLGLSQANDAGLRGKGA
jgi:hypothetical protein